MQTQIEDRRLSVKNSGQSKGGSTISLDIIGRRQQSTPSSTRKRTRTLCAARLSCKKQIQYCIKKKLMRTSAMRSLTMDLPSGYLVASGHLALPYSRPLYHNSPKNIMFLSLSKRKARSTSAKRIFLEALQAKLWATNSTFFGFKRIPLISDIPSNYKLIAVTPR